LKIKPVVLRQVAQQDIDEATCKKLESWWLWVLWMPLKKR
jgi:hypothetical protein